MKEEKNYKLLKKIKESIEAKNKKEILSIISNSKNLIKKLSNESKIITGLEEYTIELWKSRDLENCIRINLFLEKIHKYNNSMESIVFTTVRIAALMLNTSKISEAEEKLNQALDIVFENDMQDKPILINIYINLSIVFLRKNKLSKNYEFLLKAKDLAEKFNNEELLLTIFLNLQSYYQIINDWDSIEKSGKAGLKIAEKTNNQFYKTAFSNGIGALFVHRGDFQKAGKLFKESYDFLERRNIKPAWQTNSLMNLGVVELNLKNYCTAKEYLLKGLKKSQKYDLTNITVKIMTNLIDLNLMEKNYSKAKKYIEDVEELIEKDKDMKNLEIFLESKIEYFKKIKDPDKANKVYAELFSVKEKIFSQNLLNKIAQLETKYKVKHNKREKKILENQNKLLNKKNQKLVNAQKEIRKLEQKNTILAMAVSANHEINQPLTVMSGHLELIRCKAKGFDCSIEENIEKINKSIYKIKKILKKFKNFHNFKFKKYIGSVDMIDFDSQN